MGSVYVARDAKTNEIVSLLSSAKAFYGLAQMNTCSFAMEKNLPLYPAS